MSKSAERLAAFAFGVVFIITILVLAVRFPYPTPFQYTTFRIVLALAAGGVAGMIPGFLTVNVSRFIRAGGALAVFAIVFFKSPAGLTIVEIKTPEQIEIEKPLVLGASRLPGLVLSSILPIAAAASSVPSEGPPELRITTESGLSNPDLWKKRYGRIIIDGVRARAPDGATLVANDIEGIRQGALVERDFSVVARKMSNLTVDVSAEGATAKAGSLRLYVKLVENSKLLARGAAGKPADPGSNGRDGNPGSNGRNGECGPGVLGQFHSSDDGGPGGNGENGTDGPRGEDGKAGGSITLTTVVNPVSSSTDVSGGAGGTGGKGGKGGARGTGGKGGAGCQGTGGGQPTRPNGADGKPGLDGQDGRNGDPGPAGEYRLLIVPTFDGIAATLSSLPNDRLHEGLRRP
jgi:hypothetical protein